MRETMQFQLSDTFSNHLIKYDDVRKKTIKQHEWDFTSHLNT